jgi:hypothetical protein
MLKDATKLEGWVAVTSVLLLLVLAQLGCRSGPLRLGHERHDKEAARQGPDERPPLHHSIT